MSLQGQGLGPMRLLRRIVAAQGPVRLMSGSRVPPPVPIMSWRDFAKGTGDKSQGDKSQGAKSAGRAEEEDESLDAIDAELEAEEADSGPVRHNPETGEHGGPIGPEPTRFNDWERKGRVSDF
eukprot:TRINITY_DN6161_c0_g2_i2.p2 TRINITY_DN6161_c0_g2~~TRINITY_DN6161_c0_g2_i2.p2  ORF type:complete len:123 (-),score=25.59 TRINITY_DN6161_c0_g2_i2:114-482(-)